MKTKSKEKNYKFTWTKNGKHFTRKDKRSSIIQIKSKKDIFVGISLKRTPLCYSQWLRLQFASSVRLSVQTVHRGAIVLPLQTNAWKPMVEDFDRKAYNAIG